MELLNTGLHRLSKLEGKDEIELESSQIDGSNDQDNTTLFVQLGHQLQTHNQKQYGTFEYSSDSSSDTSSEQAEAGFSKDLSCYINNKLSFDVLSRQLAEQAIKHLKAVDGPFEFYVWIVESQDIGKKLNVFWLEQERSYTVSKQLSISPSHCITPSRLRYGATIDLTQWQHSDSIKYISLIAPKSNTPEALAFIQFMSFKQTIDRSNEASALFDTVERYSSTLPLEKERDFRAKVVDFCVDQTKRGAAIELESLSAHIDSSAPTAFKNFAQEGMEAPLLEWNPDYAALRRYSRYCGRDQHLSINFSSALLGREITYDQATETLTIKAVPSSLKKQLLKKQ